VRRFISWLGYLYMWLVMKTGRWRIVGTESRDRLIAEKQPFITCFWHGRLLMASLAWNRSEPFHMLISSHADGQLITQIAARFGLETLAGSSTRGGTTALKAMARILKEGGYVGITPDGPQGPRMRASIGAVALARLTGAAIVPMTFGTSSCRILNSWDKFVVPYPFGAGDIVWGAPIYVPRNADDKVMEGARLQLEEWLNRMTAEADRSHGMPPIEPAAEIPTSIETGADA